MFCLLVSLLNRRNIRRIALTLPHTPLPRSGLFSGRSRRCYEGRFRSNGPEDWDGIKPSGRR